MKVLDRIFHLAILGISIPSATFVVAFSAPTSSLQSLLTTHQSSIASLKDIATTISENESVAPPSDVFYLRYALNDSYDDDEQRIAALKSNLEWRMNEGNTIVTSAYNAIQSAMEGGKWNNEPIRNAAPNAKIINEYLTTTQCITTSLPSTNDLIYCIRAGKIDDKALMSAVSIDEMVDFFLYCKEVNAMVADMRSLQTDSLIKIVTCNDLKGVKLVGGSKDFRASLSAASKKANALYPSLNGRTLMLNLPSLLGPLVSIFKLLLPKAVTKRLRFENGPLKDVEDLREIADGGKGRDEFVDQVNALAYGD
mmetsp:Transcript_11325/g.20820  ORF Transcript_11325/g.20820 Transcript_11325/m.20820 type:complete len:310 (+) Transcript_11325:53-982(+)|eukprot:CAMPEP_0202026076 /NCGR_PEP_ID=MMETSP0905-20130828/58021_1 /ASSEMBLY_ACC=CAM_ASM_000554 /TAXON_ID=420261 /ORGANISM="Thalassiosira antarctica, Strain CCMP982" /LENGTH=309 /DNA_ID=CAMNT_0048589185 /DNA_START=41 /DNA_END=970 /DNA_ORIENTATION=+